MLKVFLSFTLFTSFSINAIHCFAQKKYFDTTQVFDWNEKKVTIKDLPKNKLYVLHYSQNLDKKVVDSVELLRKKNYINICLIYDKNTNSIKLKELDKNLPLYFLKKTNKQKFNFESYILTNSKFEIIEQTNSFASLIKYFEEYYMINDGINIEPK